MPAHRMRHPKGDWVPARFTGRDSAWIMVALVYQALVRGLDYVTGEEPTKYTSALEQATPVPFVGALLILGGLTLAVGVVTRRHLVVWIGHGGLAILYLSMSFAFYYAAAQHGLDGIRSGAQLTVVTLIHIIAWARMSPNPEPPPRRVAPAVPAGRS